MPSSAPVCRAIIQGAATVVGARDTPGLRGQSRGFDVRRWSAYVLFVVAALLVALAGLAGLVNREVLDGHGFVANVEHLRQDPRLASAIGNQVADAAVARRADLVAVKPLVAQISATVIASDAAGPIFRSAANQAHAAFTTADSDQVVLRLADFGTVVSAVLREVSPQAAAAIPADLPVRLAVGGGQGGAIGRVVQGAHLAATLAWLLPLLALACVLAGGVVLPGRRRPAAAQGRGGAVVFLLARPVQSGRGGEGGSVGRLRSAAVPDRCADRGAGRSTGRDRGFRAWLRRHPRMGVSASRSASLATPDDRPGGSAGGGDRARRPRADLLDGADAVRAGRAARSRRRCVRRPGPESPRHWGGGSGGVRGYGSPAGSGSASAAPRGLVGAGRAGIGSRAARRVSAGAQRPSAGPNGICLPGPRADGLRRACRVVRPALHRGGLGGGSQRDVGGGPGLLPGRAADEPGRDVGCGRAGPADRHLVRAAGGQRPEHHRDKQLHRRRAAGRAGLRTRAPAVGRAADHVDPEQRRAAVRTSAALFVSHVL